MEKGAIGGRVGLGGKGQVEAALQWRTTVDSRRKR